MLDQSLIKSNFIGRDGFIWWIGRIPPEGNHREQINGGGWSHRYKVRILGYDSPEKEILPDDKLRWAQVILPTTAGSGAANQSMSVAISPGDTVFGFFLDGNDLNVPVILGVLPRTSEVSTKPYTDTFEPYTGYTNRVDNDGAYLVKNESNENNANSQKSPRTVSPKQAKKIGPDERSAYSAIGDVIKAASGSSSNTIEKISTEIDNFVNKIQTITDKVSGAIGNVKELINAEIGKITAKIQKISTGLISGMVGTLYKNLAPVLNAGLKLLYKTVYTIVFSATQNDIIAHKAGVAAQTAMVAPVNAIQKALPCIVNAVIGTIGSVIKNIMRSVAENVTNFVTCISDQVIGGLINHIIGGIDSILTPLLGAVDKILMGFDVISSLRSTAEGLLSGKLKLSCNEIAPNYNSPTNQWVIGKGAKESPDVSISDILESANTAAALAESFINVGQEVSDLAKQIGSLDFLSPNFSSRGFKGLVSSCYGGPPLTCGGVKVKIFGSSGSGAVGKAILGSIITDGGSTTGSIIGIDVLNGGSNYDFPPFVEIVDECNQGYGAVARSVIDYDEDSPTYGQVIDIYIVSEGENYPLDDPLIENIEETSPEPPYIIDKIIVVDSGINYTKNDRVIDANNPEVEYKIEVGSDGEITRVLTINSEIDNVIEVKDLPLFKVKSQTGYGASLKAKLKSRKPYQGEVKQQIDCISK